MKTRSARTCSKQVSSRAGSAGQHKQNNSRHTACQLKPPAIATIAFVTERVVCARDRRAPTHALRLAARQRISLRRNRSGSLVARSISKGGNRVNVIVALLALAGCGGGSSAVDPPLAVANARAVELSDTEIAQLLYADDRRTPAGFYLETTPAVPGYIATSHLKNTDLPGATSVTQYELCTDDWTSALFWSDQVATASAVSMLSDTQTTPSYFEFGRVSSSTPPGYLRARVYRCSYLDRSNVDLHSAAGAAGHFNQRPLTASELQRLVEYLWQFTIYNNYGSAVLKSSGMTSSAGLQHTLTIASLAATSSGCDHINVFAWQHTLDTQTGALQLDVQSLWEFGAHRVDGVVALCNPF